MHYAGQMHIIMLAQNMENNKLVWHNNLDNQSYETPDLIVQSKEIKSQSIIITFSVWMMYVRYAFK